MSKSTSLTRWPCVRLSTELPKMFINTSNDSDLFAGAINNTIADEYDNDRQMKEAEPVREEAETLDSILGASEEVTEEPKKRLSTRS